MTKPESVEMHLGEAILFALAKTEGLTNTELAQHLGLGDGRSTANTVRYLARVKLIQQGPTDRRLYLTLRGARLNKLLDEITASRGGKFKPMSQAGFSLHERLAVNRGPSVFVEVST